MPWEEADVNIKHPVSQWEKWGVHGAHASLPDGALEASLILPMGRKGPAFLAYPNFQAFLGWNSAYVYSTTVAYFATRLAGAPNVDHSATHTVETLTTEQVKELQGLLNQHGYAAGEAGRQGRQRHPRGDQEGAAQIRAAGRLLCQHGVARAAKGQRFDRT